MRFIHTSDLCFGMTPDRDMPWGKERAQAVRGTLARIVSACIENNIELLFISGNLFAGQPSFGQCEEANSLFDSIPGTRVFIAAGDRDRLNPASPVRSFEWSDNVKWFTGEEPESVSLSESGITVHGLPYSDREDLLAGYRAPDDGRVHILMAGGRTPTGLPDEGNDIIGAGFAYAALGGTHRYTETAGGAVVYSGSPEPLGPEDIGTHGYCRGEILQGKPANLTFVPFSSVRYYNLSVQLTPSTLSDEIVRNLDQEMEKRGRNNIYSILIKGVKEPSLQVDLSILQSRFRIASITDISEYRYDLTDLFRKHPSDMMGFFIREMNEPDMSPAVKKALYYGIDALLHSADGQN